MGCGSEGALVAARGRVSRAAARVKPTRWYPNPCVWEQRQLRPTSARAARLAGVPARVKDHGPGGAPAPPPIPARKGGGPCAQARGVMACGGEHRGSQARTPLAGGTPPPPSLCAPSQVQGSGYRMLGDCRG